MCQNFKKLNYINKMGQKQGQYSTHMKGKIGSFKLIIIPKHDCEICTNKD